MAKTNPLLSLRPTVTEEAELVAANAAQPPQPNLADLVKHYAKLRAAVTTARASIDPAVTTYQQACHDLEHLDADAEDTARQPVLAAFKESEYACNKAIEAHLVASSALEQAVAALIPAAREHYAEQARDKRSEPDLVCPTWPPSERIIVDQNNTSRTTVVTYGACCKCEHMSVRHDRQEENPWCVACQAAHTDGSQPHAFITEEQFINRILTNAV